MSPPLPAAAEDNATGQATIEHYVTKVAEGLDAHLDQMQDRPDLAQAVQPAAITYALAVLGLAGVRAVILTATGVVPPDDTPEGDLSFILQRHSNLPQETPDDQETSKQVELSFADLIQNRHAPKEADATIE